jgi:hypothetical protein
VEAPSKKGNEQFVLIVGGELHHDRHNNTGLISTEQGACICKVTITNATFWAVMEVTIG